MLCLYENAHTAGYEMDGFIRERRTVIGRRKNFLGKRQGFIFGIGFGVGATNFAEPLAEYWGSAYKGNRLDSRATTSAFSTSIKIGHGLSDRFLLYYTSQISWHPLWNLYRDTTIANGTAGVGMMYFPLRNVDVYLLGSVGLATLVTWHPPFKLEKARPTGLAVSGGIGYELAPHLSVDFTVRFGNAARSELDDINEITLTNEVLTFLVTLNGLAY